MWICPKCLKEFDEASKICRDCGAILKQAEARPVEEGLQADAEPEPDTENLSLAEESAAGVDDGPEEFPDAEWDDTPWQCAKCGESIEANFYACWNCGTQRDGTEDPDFRPVPNDLVEPVHISESPLPPNPGGESCEKCGSSKMIPNVSIGDQGQYSDGKLKVHLEGNPAAWLFKDIKRSELRANICGECGYVELRVSNPAALYEHYLRTRAASSPPKNPE